MASYKPSIPKGTRDFSPLEMERRMYIFNTITNIFRKFGYQQIETPAMENLDTLLGKYGEEGDRLLFKVLNSGDFMSKIDDPSASNLESNGLALKICEKGLKYDLTVPFARYVVQHRNEITFPFKRFQVQPVWRADRPQKGRYREFYQCDIDVIGSNSLFNEAEMIQIIDKVFEELNLDVTVKLNNRKILYGIAESIGEEERFSDITIALDKLDKIGEDSVLEELVSKGIDEKALKKLKPVLGITGDNNKKIASLKKLFVSSETGLKGIEEVEKVFQLVNSRKSKNKIDFDLTLARGLNYYTGAIFEVKSDEVQIGSICGGGRYDNLTGIFGLQDVSGVGVSFGADRIYDVIQSLDKFPESVVSKKVMFVHFGEKEAIYCLKLQEEMHQAGIDGEIYPEPAKLKKQMAYANDKKIAYVILIGEEEMKSGKIGLKNMATGDQLFCSISEAIEVILKD